MDDFAKCNIYKVWGEPHYFKSIPKIQAMLYNVDEVIPNSIKTYDISNRNIKFKFRGTEQQFKTFLSVLIEETEFKVYKTKKCWF